MTKYCLGCGTKLQTESVSKIGYVKDIKMDYCMRCFRMIHYQDLENAYVEKDNELILKKISKSKGFCFYFVDFLNLHEEAIDFYHKIKLAKIFMVSKSDLIPKNISFEKIKKWLKETYHIEEPILFVNRKGSLQKIVPYLKEENYFVGITNAGKSSILNGLMKEQTLTESKMPNTTLEWTSRTYEGKKIYDTPGLYYHYVKEFVSSSLFQSRIKPMTYPLKQNASLIVEKMFRIVPNQELSITFLGSPNLKIEKIYDKNKSCMDKEKIEVKCEEKSNLYIKGVGIFYLKEKCLLTIYGLKKENILISKSFMGGSRDEQNQSNERKSCQ